MNKDFGERSFGKASIRALEGEGNERKFELSFSSEEPYQRWFGLEILSHADGAVDLTRLNNIGVLLFNHNTDFVLGRIEQAWIEDKRGKAVVSFDDDDDAELSIKKSSRALSKVYQSVTRWTVGRRLLQARHRQTALLAPATLLANGLRSKSQSFLFLQTLRSALDGAATMKTNISR
jgi:hypothetical protein